MRNRDHDNPRVYEEERMLARPSASAWVAVISAAAALFALGAFIRVNKNMEEYIRENRKETQELQKNIEAFKTSVVATNLVALDTNAHRRKPLPEPVAILPAAFSKADTAKTRSSPALSQYPTYAPSNTSGSLQPLLAMSGPETSLANSPAPAYFPSVPASGAVPAKPKAQALSSVLAISLQQNKIMLSGGQRDGMKIGARLTLARNNRRIGELRIVNVFDNMSVCEINDYAVTPEIGDSAFPTPNNSF